MCRLSQLLQKNGVEITPQIQALIDNFGDRWISKQFQGKFIQRIDDLLNPFVFGVEPPILLRKGHYQSTILDKIFSYTSEDFAKVFPKFEVLFLNIWCLIHASYYDYRNPRDGDLKTMFNDDGNIICYYYDRRTSDDIVRIQFKGDSAKIEIEPCSSYGPITVITIS
jgi:hypothetical protein